MTVLEIVGLCFCAFIVAPVGLCLWWVLAKVAIEEFEMWKEDRE